MSSVPNRLKQDLGREAGRKSDTLRTDLSADRLTNEIRSTTTTASDRKSVATGRFGPLPQYKKLSMMPPDQTRGRATDRRSSDRPFNRPTDQRNPTENTTASDRKIVHRADSVPCLGKKFSMMPSDRIDNSARCSAWPHSLL